MVASRYVSVSLWRISASLTVSFAPMQSARFCSVCCPLPWSEVCLPSAERAPMPLATHTHRLPSLAVSDMSMVLWSPYFIALAVDS